MSRHVVEGSGGIRLVVGWDPPLQTFFGQVHEGPEDGNPIVWVGTDLHELYELDDLARALRGHAMAITPELALQLERDREANRA